MEFADQIKELRKDRKLTQEQLSERLNVTRQAVSNWENNRNLPDIEMLIRISIEFDISLDQLILGGNNMNDMTKKLIKDGSETRKAKMNMVSVIIGAGMMLVGFTSLVIKSLTFEYIDETGLLHENFFLIPIGFLFLFTGLLIILISGIRYLLSARSKKNDSE